MVKSTTSAYRGAHPKTGAVEKSTTRSGTPMPMKRSLEQKAYWGLICSACGNAERFVEFMEYESHFVDGSMNYLHLAEAAARRYECYKCGREVQPQMQIHRIKNERKPHR